MKPNESNSEPFDALLKTVDLDRDEPNGTFLHQLRERSVRAFVASSLDQRPGPASSSGSESRWRTIMKKKVTRFSVAAAAVIAMLAALHLWGGSLESSAYARIVHELQSARTLTYTISTPSNLGDGQTIQTRCMYKAPGLLRATTASDIVTIMDRGTGKGISLVRPMKTYIELDYRNMPDTPEKDPLEVIARLRALPAKADEVLDDREIDGRMARGFRAVHQDLVTTVWIDSQGKELLRAELEYLNAPGMNAVLTDFHFDHPLDDALFSVTPPAGYSLQTLAADVSDLGEQDFVDFMRIWSGLVKDGTFPPTVNGFQLAQASMEMGRQGKFTASWTEEEKKVFGQSMYRGLMFIGKLSDANHWRYAGVGVVFGTPGTPVFWYRPQGSATYRALYADLTIHNVLPEDLPN